MQNTICIYLFIYFRKAAPLYGGTAVNLQKYVKSTNYINTTNNRYVEIYQLHKYY